MAKPAKTQTGIKAIKAIFADAQDELKEERHSGWIDPSFPRDGVKPGQWEGYPISCMPPDCPIKVVGFDVGQNVWVINARGFLCKLERLDNKELSSIFAPYLDFMMWAWPAFGEKKITNSDGSTSKIQVVKRLEVQQCMQAILQEAGTKKHTFDPHTQHRGRGGWVDTNNKFIWHNGDHLWMSNGKKLQKSRPSEHEGFLYTKGGSTITPWKERVEQDESPARRILDDLKTWKWQRPYLDPVLLLGWLGTAMMGGALKARPIIFTTGGAGVGKSTLHELVRNTLEGAVYSAVDTTAAGIYQKAKHDAIPFIIDELESKPGSSKSQSVIELARVAYTGGEIARGGADHEGTTFKMNSSFFFSAINMPPMGEQDKSRMAILNLARLDKSDGLGRKVVAKLDEDGRMLVRQILDGWDYFQNELLPDYWEVLQEQGLDSRAIDTYGTLLAAAELLVGKQVLIEMELPVDDMGKLAEIVRHATTVERSEVLDNWHQCVNHLMDSTIEAWRDGVKPSVGGVCEILVKGAEALDFVRSKLGLVNIGATKKEHVGTGHCIAIPNSGPSLAKLFDNTSWHRGVWYSALKQAPDNIILRDKGSKQKVKINGVTKHCLLLDLDAFQQFVKKMNEEENGDE